MSSSRPPMLPPQLAGYDHVRLLGSGGYSDVFLYEQQLPRRPVAIKVLLTEGLGEAGRQLFYDEANAMASVSTHPFIVTVFHAEVSPDGHPYLVMEYFPRPNFSVRARNEKIPVAEVLRTGIQVASAVETAHKAGILHRDIKPANILTSEYNRPGLTDFGIATSTIGGTEAEGLSIPWAPPEVVNANASPDVTADIYSLAATTYTLLAGRSPFEVQGGSNRTLDLIQRIDRGDPPPTGRDDVPPALERLLRHGMSRSPQDRPTSAAEFGRMLQSVEIAEGWAATHLEIREDPRDIRSRGDEPDGDGTKLKGPTVVHGQTGAPGGQSSSPSGPADGGALVTGVPGSPGASFPPSDATVAGPKAAPVADGTVMRGAISGAAITSGVGERPLGLSGVAPPRPVRPMPSGSVVAAQDDVEPAEADRAVVAGPGGANAHRSKVAVLGLAALAVAVALVAVAAVMSVLGGGDPETPVTTTVRVDPPRSAAPKPNTPTDVDVGTGQGGAKIATWKHDGEPGQKYTFQVRDNRGEVVDTEVHETATGWSAAVPDSVKCVSVTAYAGSSGSEPSTCE